jgi:GxxExxY protein
MMTANEASRVVIGAAMRVHTALGAGLLESAVGACLLYELSHAGLDVRSQVALPVVYKNVRLDVGYRVDFIVEDSLIVEIKCVEKLLPVHLAQMLTYLRLSRLELGLLINFNVPHLRDGIRRVINGREGDLV